MKARVTGVPSNVFEIQHEHAAYLMVYSMLKVNSSTLTYEINRHNPPSPVSFSMISSERDMLETLFPIFTFTCLKGIIRSSNKRRSTLAIRSLSSAVGSVRVHAREMWKQ